MDLDWPYKRHYEIYAGIWDFAAKGGKAPKDIIHVAPRELVLRHSSDSYAVNDPAMVTALGYMAKHSGRKLPVSEVAKAAGIGRQSLERRFRLQLNRTVNDELNRLRVSKMKRLLVESERTIGHLSVEVGFGTTANMHVMFKRETGMTPIAYREKHVSNPVQGRGRPRKS
jgi:LacI family transcriptional regulator